MQVKRLSRNPSAGSYSLVSEFSSEQKAVQRTGTLNSILFLPLASLVTSSSLCFALGKSTLMSLVKHRQIYWWMLPAMAFLILKKNLHLWSSYRNPDSRKYFLTQNFRLSELHAPKERQKETPHLPKPSCCRCKNGGRFSNEGKVALFPISFGILCGCLLEDRRPL